MANVKVPREKIPWYPAIDAERCIHDRECIEFCKNNVFDWDDVAGVPVVARPCNCVVGCDACAKICPSEAISFPPMDEFKATLRRLIAEAQQEKTAAPTGA
jgi:NAD-dependent dihydropyrimidine dehydrogenase PreA subunit